MDDDTDNETGASNTDDAADIVASNEDEIIARLDALRDEIASLRESITATDTLVVVGENTDELSGHDGNNEFAGTSGNDEQHDSAEAPGPATEEPQRPNRRHWLFGKLW